MNRLFAITDDAECGTAGGRIIHETSFAAYTFRLARMNYTVTIHSAIWIMQAMVTISASTLLTHSSRHSLVLSYRLITFERAGHNDNCAEQLAAIRRGPGAHPTEED